MGNFPFEFAVPPRLIAQEPLAERDQARMLLLSRTDQALAHRHFYDLPDLLQPGDLLVLNDTRVLPARLRGTRAATGGKWEGLFLRAWPDGTWEMLCQTRGRLRPGETIAMDPGPLALELLVPLGPGRWQVRPNLPGPAALVLEQSGQVPLPPYIRKGTARPEDRARYQTVFARREGAVAAPTAGLHFTPATFEKLRQRSISWTFVTLHVGLGTFQPMPTDDPAQHEMHREWGELTSAAAAQIDQCRRAGGRIIAVGTTSVRVLETAAQVGPLGPWSGETDLFIYPPYDFRAVDGLLTNFHFPKTTLLLLVSAFAGAGLLEKAYRSALEENYRFFSYGDAMLVL